MIEVDAFIHSLTIFAYFSEGQVLCEVIDTDRSKMVPALNSYYLHVEREISQLQHAVVSRRHKVKLAMEAKIEYLSLCRSVPMCVPVWCVCVCEG